MAGTVLSQPPTSFDFYPISARQAKKQYIPSLSPVSLYSQQGYSTDSAPSPTSPTSPVFTSPYQLPTGEDWLNWQDDNKSPEFFKAEAFEPDFSSVPTRNLSQSPAINPMDLANPLQAEDVPFGQEGANDTQPLFSNPRSDPQGAATSLPPLQRQDRARFQQSAIKTSPSGSPQMSILSSPRYPSRKRKPSPSNASPGSRSARSSPSPPPDTRRAGPHAPKKTAHNMIEKRYRTNLNDKIAALRDSVPALRVMVHRLESAQHGGGGSSDEADGEDMIMEEDLGGLAPAHKLNKATILGKATEYIAHLERKNRSLAKENAALRSRVEGFEMLIMSRGGAGSVWN